MLRIDKVSVRPIATSSKVCDLGADAGIMARPDAPHRARKEARARASLPMVCGGLVDSRGCNARPREPLGECSSVADVTILLTNRDRCPALTV